MKPVHTVLGEFSDCPSLLDIAFFDAVQGAEQDDEMAARLLDAAFEQFCRTGIKRSTMSDVARLAGVSRITVYRRYASKSLLVEHVVRREFRQYFDQFIVDIRSAGTIADRVAVGFASSMRAIRHNPLIGGLMIAEPDAIVPSMTSDGGRTLGVVQQFVAGRLLQEQSAGNVATDVDVGLVAEMMVRISASLLVIPSHVVDLDDEAQMRAVAVQFLVPMLGPGRDAHSEPPVRLDSAVGTASDSNRSPHGSGRAGMCGATDRKPVGSASIADQGPTALPSRHFGSFAAEGIAHSTSAQHHC
ncbi:TetR/AcrR family transcriptional regulator [Streptomyces atroolivaceus]|uniref:TetR/AcrR family transcriptional regulator n=1 Tax=Streptomyces atroolivaceus TaxID=66869 RepID=UPI0036514ECB